MFDVSARSPSPARFRHKRAIVVVALGFLATCVPPMAIYAPFLVNRTTAVADVRITWVLAKVDCASSPDALARTLTPSDLDDPRTVSLTSGQVAALDQPSLPGQSPAGVCRLGPFAGSTPSPCIAAVLESDGATPVLMLASPGWIVSGSDGLSSCGATTPPPSRCQTTLDPAVDPGVDAVSLVLRKNGQTQFAVSSQAADAKVRIAPIDLSAVAARPSASGGCRSLRDAYHAELANSACVTNSDCDVVPLLELPGETRPVSGCGSYLNRTAAAKVRAVSRSFALCQGGPLTCETPDPPGCVGGQCTAICAGETLPYCPPNCTHFPGVSFGEGETCNTNIVCFAADGRRCHCAVNTLTVACAGDLPISASCPYSCRPSAHYSDDAASPNYVDRTDAGGDGTTDGGTADAHGG